MKARLFAVLALAITCVELPALAQNKRAEIEAAKRAAVQLADKGVEAFRSEKYKDAIETFRQAEAKFHVPKFLLYIARSQIKLGQLLEAKATYRTVIDEKLPAYAPGEFFTAQSDAKKELDELESRIPTVRIEVNGLGDGMSPNVTLDTKTLSASELGQPIAANPGSHSIVVEVPGQPSIERSVVLTEGRSESVILELRGQQSGASVPPEEEPPDNKKGTGLPTVTLASWGVGAAGLVTFAVMGGLALGKSNEYNENPTRTALDDGRVFALVADIGIGAAVAGAAVGTVYWLVTKPKASPANSWMIAPFVGTNGGGVWAVGQF